MSTTVPWSQLSGKFFWGRREVLIHPSSPTPSHPGVKWPKSASPKVLSVAPFIGTIDGHPLTYTQFLLPQPWSLYLEQKHHFYTVLEQTSPLSHLGQYGRWKSLHTISVGRILTWGTHHTCLHFPNCYLTHPSNKWFLDCCMPGTMPRTRNKMGNKERGASSYKLHFTVNVVYDKSKLYSHIAIKSWTVIRRAWRKALERCMWLTGGHFSHRLSARVCLKDQHWSSDPTPNSSHMIIIYLQAWPPQEVETV